jgi:hypothetical protein
MTDSQIEEMIGLYEIGFDMEQLGAHFGISSSTILKWLRRMCVPTHPHAVLLPAAAEMILLGANGGIVGTKREAWNHPQRDQAVAWAKAYLDGERALRAAA